MNLRPDLSEIITARLGLMERSAWSSDLPKAIEFFTKKYSCEVQDIEQFLARDPDAVYDLAEHLTVGETYFLRHPDQLTYVSNYLAARCDNSPASSIAILSAGCSSGEEPYSLAIRLKEDFPADRFAQVKLNGVDINKTNIDKAKAGRYTAWSFRNVPPWVLARYFKNEGENFILDDRIRRQVDFSVGEIISFIDEAEAESYDAIFFRNVAIYLEKQFFDRIIEGFRRLIKPAGLLVLAPTDPPVSDRFFASVGRDHPMIFNKTDGAPSASRPVVLKTTADRHPKGNLRRSMAPARTAFRFRKGAGAAPSPKPAPVEPTACSTRGTASAIELGDAGEIKGALLLIDQMIAQSPSSKVPFLLRGKIYLAEGNNEEAVDNFRKAVFLDPCDKIGRYWYAVSLSCTGKTRMALVQLRELISALGILEENKTLEDGETMVRSLLDEAEFLQAALR